MSASKDLHELNNKLDLLKRKLANAEQLGDVFNANNFKRDIGKLQRQIGSIKGLRAKQNMGRGEELKALGFSRGLTKQEQADLGKLKQSVKGLVVVHPLTALGREMALNEVTGFAPAAF
jgi:ribosome-associated protein